MGRNVPPEFATRLHELRKASGLSQAELATLAGTGQAVIAHLERAERQPSLELAYRLARALGVTVNHLLPDQVVTTEGRRALRGNRANSQ